MRPVHGERLALLFAALLGALFFIWIAGTAVLSPTETSWSLNGDWRVHFLGWHLFRHEPWHLPPGRIERYFVPLGTSIGLTDSIPIAAFLMKPLSPWLPPAFQYLGLWLCLCFALQGAFTAWLMRLWTSNAVLQVLGAVCVILTPTLLMRTLHPALCAHWLLLWALRLYFRADRNERAPFLQTTALALVAGLIHPYLAVMVLVLLIALGLRVSIGDRVAGFVTVVMAVSATLAGWWLSGLFTIGGESVAGAEGLRKYSMNLLAPITSTGWSSVLPEIPLGAEGQLWEGFQYFGVGLLLLLLAALVVRLTHGQKLTIVLWPLALAVTLLAIYSLSPRVTFAHAAVVDITHPWIDRLSIFRATGRFFWPAAYLLLIAALAAVVSRLTPRLATVLLCVVIVVQCVDLRGAYASNRQTWRSDQIFAWRTLLPSPVWQRILPHYSHIVMFPPSYCGNAPPGAVEFFSYLAGMYGLSLNGGLVARFDETARRLACDQIVDTLRGGWVDDSRLYVGRQGEIDLLRGVAQQPVVCGVVDRAVVCATTRSYEAWRDVAHLE